MSPRTTKRAASVSSRDRIRHAAKALFAERGYEAATTAEVARRARTSQSQLVKHFVDKQGLLESIFQSAWQQLNPAILLAIEKLPSAREKLKMIFEMVVGYMEKDHALRTLFLLEGRRIRGDGHMVVLVPGFIEFVSIVDDVVKEVAAQADLAPGVHPQALRSGLMGAVEGMLRDRMLVRPSRLPAAFAEPDVRRVFQLFVDSCLKR